MATRSTPLDRPSPPLLDRRQLLIGSLLLGAAGAGTVLAPKRVAQATRQGALDKAVPHRIGSYQFLTQSGLVLPPQDDLSQRIYDDVLTRVYTAPGLPPVMLMIAYGSVQDYGLQLHRPDVCYPASGYRITYSVPAPLRGIAGAAATFLTAEREERIEQVYFWTRIGSDFPATNWDERLAVLGANLRRKMPDGVLVRVSVIEPDRAKALPVVMAFNAALLASLGADGKRLILGRA